MRFEDGFVTEASVDEVREAVRGYYLGEGYEDVSPGGDGLALRRGRGWLASWGGMRAERLPTRVEVRLRSRGDEDAGTSVRISYDVTTRWQLVTRVDCLYYELEVAALARYVETGFRRSASLLVAPVRRPIATAVILNVAMSTLLVGIAGALAQLPLTLSISVAFGVAIANSVAILGFADIVVEAMEEVTRRR